MTIKAHFEAYGLTSLDHTIPPCYVRFAVLFPVPNVTLAVESLQKGAALLTFEFPIVTGCVAPVRTPGARKGALQIVPPSHLEKDHASILKVKHHKTSYHARWTTAEEEYLPLALFADPHTPAPILRLEANVMTDGIILGVAFHHQAMDATGAGVLMRDLARCCTLAGGGAPQATGKLETSLGAQSDGRALLSTSGLGRPLLRPGIDHSADYPVIAPADRENMMRALQQAARSLTTKRFLLPAEKLESLANACNNWLRESSEDLEERPRVSKNDVLVSLFWMRVTRARQHRPNEIAATMPSVSEIFMAVNIRGRTTPSIPATYIGNALVPLREGISMDVMLDDQPSIMHTLSRLAYAVRKKLRSIDDTSIRSTIAYLEGVSDLSALAASLGDFNVSSWRDTGIGTADFGHNLGMPVDMMFPEAMGDGQVFIWPKRHHDNAWVVQVTLHQEVMERLCADEVLASYTCCVSKQS
ncbi:transferase family-domain-containing protein [Aspergillus floccosus]